MSWLRSAVHRAVEASGGRSSLLTRTVRTSLDTVVHHAGQAVAGGARLIIGSRNYKSVKVTAKRLEEAALSYKGEERAQLLRRWRVALKENQRAAAAVLREPQFGDDRDQAAPLLDLYVDYESGGELMNFFHVFLYSHALECVVLSMLTSMQATYNAIVLHYRMCLSGGKDVHNALLSSVKDLARLISSYHDEVLAKRGELLQFAQGAVSGLKINAEIARLDNEISQLQQQINSMDALRATSNSNQNRTSQSTTEGFKKAVAEVDKLKVLSESLSNSSTKTEKRIMENRLQKEESLIFRVTKTNEVSGIEKELVAEISGLEEQRDKLEAELKKEDELARSLASCKVEASTVSAWISFLEDTWKLQSLFEDLKEKQANEELDRCGVCFAKLIKHHVSACLEELSTSIDRIKTFVDNLKIFGDRSMSAEDGPNSSSKQSNPRKYLEEEYLQTEKKVVAAFSLVDSIRAIYSSNQEYYKTRREEPEVKKLFDTIDNLRVEFESVPRPVLQIEIKEQEEKAKRSRSLKVSRSPGHSRSDSPIAPQLRTRLPSETESELAKFDPEYKADEISGWEFDDLEDEPRPGFQ
ncbi:GRIP and coiled-coil domain-containing protein C27D7.02c-like [Panicum miliaceum]|uniref:GRIP and coiled-coil domain-containing protein C27D7.02c-like n=1 Tax=Panicum miliaceum TaxID=4540 RepID=A0A3L6S9Q7_PANMI|nr:GRIP and coiled-coil domain-containing protein C27D7.02c-like [Panicum miliaceum]